MKFFRLGPLLLLAVTSAVQASQINIVSRGDDNAAYAIGMINLALKELGDSAYQMRVQEEAWTAPRLRQGLIDGKIDVIWTATSKALEQDTIPIRVPLYKWLLGNRIFIITKDNASLFRSVRSLEDLKHFRFCQGRNWTDTTILTHNGLEVVGGMKYEGLFYMTEGGRCDAYPRGVHEPWSEIERYADLDLTVDEHVMLVYRMPYYLFVSKHKPELAEDIQRGLLKAIENGSFDKYFYSDRTVRSVLERANLQGRTVIHLENPDLPAETPLDAEHLWF